MHLIINLEFLTSFQFINLFNLALWVNNRCKWITIIFLNLWCVTIFYIVWFVFFLLSLVFAFIYLYLCLCLLFVFVFVLYSPYFRHWPNPTTDAINLFSNLFFNIFSNLYKLYSLSLSIYLFYNIRERATNTESQSQKAKKKKKKNNR